MILRYSCQSITPEDEQSVLEALRSDWLTQGPKVQEFEEALAAYCGSRYAVAVTNGTVALELAYVSAGLSGDVVATSPLTFLATANALLRSGAVPHFVDVDPLTGNMVDEDDSRHWCVPVHYAGRACRITGCSEDVIEDSCHALGAMDFDGCSRVGSCAHSLATVFSFHPVKPITTGEGGAITTNDESLAKELRSRRDHGRENGLMVRMGINARMTELQAALGISQLKRCDEMQSWRGHWAWTYIDALRCVPGLVVPEPECLEYDLKPWDSRTSWHLFPVRIKNGRRDEVKAKLNAQGIGAQIHYSPIVPLHPYYRQRFGFKPGDFPNAEAWAAEELSLPLHAGMSERDVETVVSALREALA